MTVKNFIPKPYASICVTIRMREDKKQEISKIANQYDLSCNALINQCIDFALQNMESITEFAASKQENKNK